MDIVKACRICLLGVLLPVFLGACSSKREPVVINVNPAPPQQIVQKEEQKRCEPQQSKAECVEAKGSTFAAINTANSRGEWRREIGPSHPMQPVQPSVPIVSQVIERIDEASFFNTQVHDLAVQLLKNFRGDIGPEGPIAVSTFVDLNHLYRTSPLGRYLAEQLMGELQRAGFTVVDVRKTNSMLMKEKYGEYSLSRNVAEIAKETSARYILVGTYVVRDKYVLINARLVSNDNNMILSSGLKIMRRDPFIERMLWPAAAPPEEPAIKLPVKGFGEPTEVRLISGS